MTQTSPAPVVGYSPALGYQPALDGLRALSVCAVILYHAGFSWFGGGFLGVEVFFVISGFLITTLLIEEHRGSGRVSLTGFWMRRARRLLPALFLMLIAVATWTVLQGSAAQQTELRRDLPWSVFYGANWGQIVHGVPYFSHAQPALLRHLWSLGVEEQWYLLWPLVFVFVLARRSRPATFVLYGIGAAWFVSWWIHSDGWLPVFGSRVVWDAADRVNIDYLSTFTRAGGLLIGALGAFAWHPWRSRRAAHVNPVPLDVAAAVGSAVLLAGCIWLTVTSGAMYPWLLGVMSIASLVLVAVAVHPSPTRARAALSWRPLNEIGRRSYGLYLWHWPIFVIAGATGARVGRVVPALAVAVLVTELSYRFVERPIRTGAFTRWWRHARVDRWAPVAATTLLVGSLVAFYEHARPFDAAAGGAIETFDPGMIEPAPSTTVFVSDTPTAVALVPLADAGSTAPTTSARASKKKTAAAPPPSRATEPSSTESSTSFTLPEAPIELALIGDSQAYTLAVNLPAGIERVFRVRNGGIPGCSVHSSGEGISAQGFKLSYAKCKNWTSKWKKSAQGEAIALVTLGAWDVLDYRDGGTTMRFGTPAFDEAFTSGLEEGIAALTADGAHTALLEVPCMRPPEHAKKTFTPRLPERLDDARVAHLNKLLRKVAAADAQHVTFITGPREWCHDEAIATDLGYRWDGVHVWRPGAKLVFDTITAQLLAIPTG